MPYTTGKERCVQSKMHGFPVKKFVIGILILSFFFAHVPISYAQADNSTDSGPYITKFAGISWGAPEKAIREKYGEPLSVSKIHKHHPEGPTKKLEYNRELLNEDVTMSFMVREKEGLIAGLYIVDIDESNGCEMAYEKFQELIADQYPNIEPETTRYKRPSVMLSFCDLLETENIQNAARLTEWKDPANKARIIMMLRNTDFFKIQYQTPKKSKIKDENQKAQADQAF